MMASLIRLRERAQITLPKETLRKLNIKTGDNLAVEIDDGRVILTPVAIIPKDELWAWKPEIRKAISEGRKEAREGNLKAYDSVDELWNDLFVAENDNEDL